jgi:hypothetical protein
MLREWQAPDAPPSLDAKVLGARRQSSWWKWMLTGSIRIPVPVGILAAIAIAWILFQVRVPPKPSVPEGTYANFQPVQELKPVILRNSDESR